MDYINEDIREAIKPPTISNMELFTKTKSFIENLKGVEIDVKCGTFDSNYIEWEGGNRFTISIQTPSETGVEPEIAFYHEISHVVFDSLVGQAHKLSREWGEQFPQEFRQFATDMWISAFNLLEDTRIESQWGKIYAGTDKKFLDTRKRLGESLPRIKFNNPIYSLQGARMFRDDLVYKGHELAIQAMKDVANTSLEGSIIIANRYCDKVVKDYINKKVEQAKQEQEQRESDAKKMLEGIKLPEYTEPPKTIPPPKQEEYEKMKPEEQKAVQQKIADDYKKQREVKNENYMKKKQFENKMLNIQQKIADRKKQEEYERRKELQQEKLKVTRNIKEDHNSFLEQPKRENKEEKAIDMNQKTDSLKAKGSEEAKAIIDAISNQNMQKTMKGSDLDQIIGQKVLSVERPEGEIRENKMITRWIEKTFKSIANKPKERIEDFGNAVSIPHLIRARARGFGAFYKNTKKQRSIAVLLMVDGSGSMRVESEITNEEGYNLTRFDVMRDLTASIFDPLEKIKNIDFKACIWSGNKYGNLCITNLDKKEDIKQISKSDAHLTPTHLALAYGGKYLNRMRGKDKYIIMMTDGVPEHAGTELGVNVDKKQLIDAAKKECKAIKGRGNKVLGIFLGDGRQEELMREIFGGEYVRCTTMAEVQTATLKKMKRILVGR